ncbi:MAG: copper-binding protein [Burkholderiaceae bacterium]|nr:copper-binding protein [Burkholderiaceae bacterium]
MKPFFPTLLAALALAVPAVAQQAAAAMADGEVRKVDKDAARLTLRHGEIKNLDMPPMTMVFNVKDKALLDRLKAGDKVRFAAVNEGGKYIVTEIQVVP